MPRSPFAADICLWRLYFYNLRAKIPQDLRTERAADSLSQIHNTEITQWPHAFFPFLTFSLLHLHQAQQQNYCAWNRNHLAIA